MSKVFLTTKYHKSMTRCVFVWLLLTRTGTSYFNAAGSGSVLNTYGSLTPLSVLQVAVRDGFSVKIRRWKDVKQNCCITAAVFLAKLEARLWTVAPRILILCVLILYLWLCLQVKTLYEQVDPPNPSLRRESAELYFKENVPPLIFSQAFEVGSRYGWSTFR